MISNLEPTYPKICGVTRPSGRGMHSSNTQHTSMEHTFTLQFNIQTNSSSSIFPPSQQSSNTQPVLNTAVKLEWHLGHCLPTQNALNLEVEQSQAVFINSSKTCPEAPLLLNQLLTLATLSNLASTVTHYRTRRRAQQPGIWRMMLMWSVRTVVTWCWQRNRRNRSRGQLAAWTTTTTATVKQRWGEIGKHAGIWAAILMDYLQWDALSAK